jgi:hypothetical protein
MNSAIHKYQGFTRLVFLVSSKVKPENLSEKDRNKLLKVLTNIAVLQSFKKSYIDDFNDQEIESVWSHESEMLENLKPDTTAWEILDDFIKIISDKTFDAMVNFYTEEAIHIINIIKFNNLY